MMDTLQMARCLSFEFVVYAMIHYISSKKTKHKPALAPTAETEGKNWDFGHDG